MVFIVGSERFGIGVADRGGFNFWRWLSLFFFAVDFLPKENLSKFYSDGSDILCKFMDVRNQQCDLDLISMVSLVKFFQGQDVWWVGGGIIFLATILVYDGLEWLRRPNLNVGNWKRQIGIAVWLLFGERARLDRSFRLVNLVGGVNLLSNLVGQLYLDVEEFFNGSRHIVGNSEAINWCHRFVKIWCAVVMPEFKLDGEDVLGKTVGKHWGRGLLETAFTVMAKPLPTMTSSTHSSSLPELQTNSSRLGDHTFNEIPTPMDMDNSTMWMRRIRLFDRGLSQDTLRAGMQREFCAHGIYCFSQAKPVQEAYKKLLLFAGVRSWLEAIKRLAVGKHARDRCSEHAFLPVDFARVSEHVLLLPFICVN